MKTTILVDGMFCIYDKEFNVNEKLLEVVNGFSAKKILVVNGFREKGREALEGNGFEAFSLEEEEIKKDNPEFFKRLLSKYNLKPEEVIYFDHDEGNVKTAKQLGITAMHYEDDEVEVGGFLKGRV